ncbi:MAG TPA: MFS transporter [Symbiobacteriaceae bacterium]|nr:MFS transporter [Symbiobacteriaceae bacterium]
MGILRRLRGLQPGEAVILLADLAINTGFFMLIPYISVHVRENLGLTATIAGTVLAVRTGVQQVLMVLAGPMADLYGYKRVLLAGLLIRAAGFSSFALMGDLPGLILSAVLSGTGGALFSSAERAAYAALNPGPEQTSRFALLYTAQSTGTTIGPLVGAFLLNLDFRVLSLVAGFVYIPIALLVYYYLPDLSSGRERPAPARAVSEVIRSILTVARNRAFVVYCLVSAGFWAISGQINISLSLHAVTMTGNQTAVKNLLLISSLMVIALQYRLTQWTERRLPPLVLWSIGSALAGLSFLLVIPFPGMVGLVACVVGLTLGGMLLRPVDYQMVVGMAPRDAVASYYGFSALSVAIGGSTGQFLGGRLTDIAETTGPAWLTWVVFAALGIGAALTMRWFDRRQSEETGRGTPAW